MKKSVASQIAELQRELENAEQAYRQADDDWRLVDTQYVQLKRLREELDVHKRDLAHEIDWRVREIAALEEALKYERTIA
ncbi:hypothetical protein [Brevibacillus choshinensis]|uniref:Uncharacterized protein n=1 Tax=Brevibacillus choshinensis TaxID=54911 RepID=A0ABX7FI47_BRECH|nr:hypothetical protein [Brevibacillus choshinensis]QRG65279.1 hypothetical protein JNE38_16705 [Brevibacillus choshinensis]